MEPINYVGALRRSWRLLLALGVIGAVVAVLMPLSHVKQQKPVLKFKANAVVGAAPRGGGNLIGGNLTGAQIAFYATSVSTLQDTANFAKTNNPPQHIPAAQLSRYMTATLGAPKAGSSATASTTSGKGAKGGSNIVTLTTYGRTKDDAIHLANDYTAILGDVITYQADSHAAAAASAKTSATAARKGGSGSSSPSPGTSTTPPVQTGFLPIAYASTATRVPSPNGGALNSHKVRAPLGLLLGVLFGAAIVIVRTVLDRRVRTSAQAASTFGYPVLVQIPERPAPSADERAAPLDVASDPAAPDAEAYRMLRMSVLFEALATNVSAVDPFAMLGNGHGTFGASVPTVPALANREAGERHVILVVSADDEATRPVVAANLAAVYAEAGQRVIVAATRELGVGGPVPAVPHGGLLTGDIRPVDVEARLEPSRIENVSRLPLPLFLQNSGQLVTRGKDLLDAARSVSDVIIVETPALLLVHHAEALSRAADVVVVVSECGMTRLADAKRSAELLRRIGAPVLGVVLTNTRVEAPRRRRGALASPTGPAAAPLPAADEVTPRRGIARLRSRSEEPTAPTQV
jgi:Mrp family chromosome partitioning ATPase